MRPSTNMRGEVGISRSTAVFDPTSTTIRLPSLRPRVDLPSFSGSVSSAKVSVRFRPPSGGGACSLKMEIFSAARRKSSGIEWSSPFPLFLSAEIKIGGTEGAGAADGSAGSGSCVGSAGSGSGVGSAGSGSVFVGSAGSGFAGSG